MEILDKMIRRVPDFPKEGILFYDIMPVLQDPVAFGTVIEALAEPFHRKKIEIVCAMESRGFIFGAALANDLGAGFVPVRKPGKLPFQTISQEYDLEYGKDSLEIHRDAIQPGQKVLIVDDLIATGGTAKAAVSLIRELKGELVGAAFVIELMKLNGRAHLDGVEISSLWQV